MNNISSIVNRFLSWDLPVDFSPDSGISFCKTVNEEDRFTLGHAWWPCGTNLLTAQQAREMFEYLLNSSGMVLVDKNLLTTAIELTKEASYAEFARQPLADELYGLSLMLAEEKGNI